MADHSYAQTLTIAFIQVKVLVMVTQGADLGTILDHLGNHDPVLVRETYLALRNQTGPSSDLARIIHEGGGCGASP